MTVRIKKGSSKREKLQAWKKLTEVIVSKGVNTPPVRSLSASVNYGQGNQVAFATTSNILNS